MIIIIIMEIVARHVIPFTIHLRFHSDEIIYYTDFFKFNIDIAQMYSVLYNYET